MGKRFSFCLLHRYIIHGLDTDKSSAAAGQLTVYAHVEPQIGRLAVIFVQLAVAMPVQHDRAVGLAVPGQQRIVAQVQHHVVRQPGAHARTNRQVEYLCCGLEIVRVGFDRTVVVTGYEIFASGQFLQQMPGVFAFEECKIAEDVDHILLVHGRPPKVEQPCVVCRRIVPVGKRPVRLVPEYVLVAEMQVGVKNILFISLLSFAERSPSDRFMGY